MTKSPEQKLVERLAALIGGPGSGEGAVRDACAAALRALADERDALQKNIKNYVEAARREHDRHVAEIAKLEAECDALRKERDAARESEEALEAKLKALAPHTCGCSYDKPDDLCLHHSPQLAAALAQVAELREALEKANHIYNEWMLDDHYEAITPLRAMVEVISAALANAPEEPFDEWTEEETLKILKKLVSPAAESEGNARIEPSEEPETIQCEKCKARSIAPTPPRCWRDGCPRQLPPTASMLAAAAAVTEPSERESGDWLKKFTEATIKSARAAGFNAARECVINALRSRIYPDDPTKILDNSAHSVCDDLLKTIRALKDE